eukprot:CAMPEP_0170741986 /NCGR_PEP_ID=MMETSP0437-20130122/6507_1 /TAXON_ID=0 /ORGANISM="Sexangularia sp." /LENGTH=460 /DNA_ID=CAMNT_0011080585 /DNA_START=110 /DNA_END=1492 /DNA_ORIENTATION=+
MKKPPSSIYREQDFVNELPPASGYQDGGFALAFVVHLLCLIGLTVYGLVHSNPHDSTHTDNQQLTFDASSSNTDEMDKFLAQLLVSLILTVFASIIVGLAYLWTASRYPHQLIVAAIVFHCLMWFVYGVGLLFAGVTGGAIVCFVMGALSTLVWCFWRRRVAFAAALLSTSSRILQQWPATIFSGFGFMLAQLAFVILWTVAAIKTNDWATGGTAKVLWVFLVLSLYWTSEVIRNVYTCTVAGVASTWYFLGGVRNAIPSNPTLKSFKRATTTSFGSICFGSLIVALIETIRALVRSARSRQNALLLCLVDCLLSCIEGIVRYFNSYAYVLVATYGRSYCDSAKTCFQMFKDLGLFAMINDVIVFRVIGLVTFVGGLVGGLLGALIGRIIISAHIDGFEHLWVVSGVAGFLSTMVVFNSLNSVLTASIRSIFVNFALEPEILRGNDEFLFAEFAATSSFV